MATQVVLGDTRLTLHDSHVIADRDMYNYTITHIPTGREYSGNDLSSSVYTETNPADMLASLASFLSAAIEAQDYPDSDNRDIFPGWLVSLVANDSDDISIFSQFQGYHDNNDDYAAIYGECIWCCVREPDWTSDICYADEWVEVIV